MKAQAVHSRSRRATTDESYGRRAVLVTDGRATSQQSRRHKHSIGLSVDSSYVHCDPLRPSAQQIEQGLSQYKKTQL